MRRRILGPFKHQNPVRAEFCRQVRGSAIGQAFHPDAHAVRGDVDAEFNHLDAARDERRPACENLITHALKRARTVLHSINDAHVRAAAHRAAEFQRWR